MLFKCVYHVKIWKFEVTGVHALGFASAKDNGKQKTKSHMLVFASLCHQSPCVPASRTYAWLLRSACDL